MATNLNERVEDPSQAGVDRYVGLEHLDPESLKIARWGKPTDVEATKLRFHPGDIIFGKRRFYQRKLAVADFEGICSAHALVLRAKEDLVHKDFLPFFMLSDQFFDRAMMISVGGLSPTINWSTLAKQEFALPPISEQRRIAEILWAAEASVRLNTDLSAAADKSYAAVTESKLEDDMKRESIPLQRVKDVAKVNAATLSERTSPDAEIDYVDIACVLGPKQLGSPKRMAFGQSPSRARRVVRSGDILLATVRPYFRSFVHIQEAPPGMVASTGFAVVTPGPAVHARFLFHAFFTRRFLRHCRGYMTGTNYPAITATDIAKYRLYVPDMATQGAVVRCLDALEETAKRAADAVRASSALRRELLQHALAPREE
ncbi:MAG: restriction endonuclease subunit S [candidate division WOR-3 bacterium]|nr:restriction endonuclease subunit S [candidate division WOR-3 bacterium]